MRRLSPATLVSAAIFFLVAAVPAVSFRRGQLLVAGDGRGVIDPYTALSELAGRWNLYGDFGGLRHPESTAVGISAPVLSAFRALGLPLWFGQRILIVALLLIGASGVVRMLRAMHWEGDLAARVTGFAYMLSPYSWTMIGGNLGPLVAWSALGWLIYFTVRSLERPGWRMPAAFAVVLGLVAVGEPAAIIYVLIGPLLWLLYSVLIAGDTDLGTGLRAAGRIAVAGAAVSVSWVWPILLRPNEILDGLGALHQPSQANRALSTVDVMRGLGEPNVLLRPGTVSRAAQRVATDPLMWLTTALIASIGVLSCAVHRFRNRIFFVGLAVIGLLFAVGSYPAANPEPYGRFIQRIGDSTFSALISPTQRAVPLVSLGLCACLGAGAERWATHFRNIRLGAVAAASVVMLGALPWLSGQSFDTAASIHESSFETVDASIATRVLEYPAFNPTVDPAGTAEASVVSRLPRASVVNGSHLASSTPAGANTTMALYRALESGSLSPSAVGPLLQILGFTHIVLSDGPSTPEGDRVRELLDHAPGITPTGGLVPGGRWYKLVTPLAPVRVVGTHNTVVAAADAQGLIDMATAGLVTPDQLMLHAAALGDSRSIKGHTAVRTVIVTDSNRWREERLGTRLGDVGVTGRPGIDSISDDDSGLERRPAFPAADESAYTVVHHRGGASVRASRSGGLRSSDWLARPVLALDGRDDTAWWVSPATALTGSTIEILFDEPTSIDSVSLTPMGAPDGRGAATAVSIDVDGETVTERVQISPSAPTPLPLPPTTARSVRIEVLDVAVGSDASVPDRAGFAEVTVGDLVLTESTVLPSVLEPEMDRLGLSASATWIALITRDQTERVDQPTVFQREVRGPERAVYSIVGRFSSPGPVADGDLICRDDLLTINATSIEVALTESQSGSAPLDGRTHYDARLCGGPYAPSQRLLNVVSTEQSGLRLEQLVLRWEQPAPTAEEPIPVEDQPVEASGVNASLSATFETIRDNRWLVVNQSYDPEWGVEVSGTSLSDVRPANGASQVWAMQGRPDATNVVTARWRMQRTFNLAALFSGAALLLCLLLAAIPFGRRYSHAPLTATNELADIHSSIVVLVTLGVFGIAGGAVPGLAAGIGALAIDRWPQLRSYIAWAAPTMLFGVLVARALGRLADPDWYPPDTVTNTAAWVSLALAVTVAIASSDRRPALPAAD